MTSGPGAIIAVAWIVAIAVWLIGSMTNKRTVRRQPMGTRLLEMLPLIAGLILLRANSALARWASTRFVPPTLEWPYIGAAVTVAGIVLAIWSRFYLGTNWSASVTVKQDHQLIRSGPYSVVRHPIYSGFLVAILGTAIYVGEVRGLCALVLVLIGWKIKSLREESYMENEFGEQYVAYRRQVKGLIPFLW